MQIQAHVENGTRKDVGKFSFLNSTGKEHWGGSMKTIIFKKNEIDANIPKKVGESGLKLSVYRK